jgi:hypothetical protein
MNIAQGAASASGTGAQSPAIAAGYVVGGSVGVTMGPQAVAALAGTLTSGIDQTVAYASTAFKQVGQAISDLGTAAYGFDWTIDCAYASGVPAKTFNLWYPRAGRTQQQQQAAGSAVVFNMGGSSGQKYQWPTGVNQPSNVLFGAGSGSGNNAIASVASNPDLFDAGWPLTENSVSFTDVVSQALLDQITLAYLNAVQLPIALPEIWYNAGSDSDQPLGSFALGDDVRLMIPPDPYFQTGYDSAGTQSYEQWGRVQQVDVQVNDEGKSFMHLVLGTPPTIVHP